MDDARLANEMTLDGIARQLEAIRSDVAGVKSDVASMKSDMTGMKSDMTGVKSDMTGMKSETASLKDEMRDGFRKIGEDLNAARIRDEKLHRLMTFGLEAREGLRESVETRFDATDKKHDEEIDLLKDVLRALRP